MKDEAQAKGKDKEVTPGRVMDQRERQSLPAKASANYPGKDPKPDVEKQGPRAPVPSPANPIQSPNPGTQVPGAPVPKPATPPPPQPPKKPG